MKNRIVSTLLFAFALTTISAAQEIPETQESVKDISVYDLKMTTLSGEESELSKYKDKVVVFVNVASKCGFTKQYEQLQALHDTYSEDGLAIVGVPCNQFGGQEPGSEKEIAEFCQKNYGVEFDMLAKVDVNGNKQCELYKYLTSQETEPVGSGPVKWNFEKFILNREGQATARFGSRESPDGENFKKAIEAALGTESTVDLPYSHESSKSGKTYYLFKKEVPLKNSEKVQTIYYFSGDPENKKGTPLAEVPAGKVVSETKTGMLVLKNKK